MLATTTVDPVRFRRLGMTGRLRLRAVRRRQVRLAELAHRELYATHVAYASDGGLVFLAAGELNRPWDEVLG